MIIQQDTANAIMDALADGLPLKVTNINGEVLAVGEIGRVFKNAIEVDGKRFFYRDGIKCEIIS